MKRYPTKIRHLVRTKSTGGLLAIMESVTVCGIPTRTLNPRNGYKKTVYPSIVTCEDCKR